MTHQRSIEPGSLPIAAGPLLAAIFLASLNLRAPLASVPPLVPDIEVDLALTGAGAGLLTTLPVLCMGIFAPLANRLAQRFGREGAVAAALTALLLGLLLRFGGHHRALLYAGTAAVGMGIAICGTVLPGIVKEFFAARTGLVTGVYMVAMMSGATAAAALAVPLADLLGGWHRSIGAWAVLAAAGLSAWLPVVRRVNDHSAHDSDEGALPGPRHGLPWRTASAWTITSYLAIQSSGFYGTLAWLAPSYESRGWSAAAAGALLAVFSVVQVFSGIGGPSLSDRLRDRRPVIAGLVVTTAAGLTGLVLAPDSAPWLWVVLLGVGQGGGFALGLVLLVDHAADPAASARLSAMAFLIAYSVASLSPLVLGVLRDRTGGFTASWSVLLALTAAQLVLVTRLRAPRHAPASCASVDAPG